MTIRRLTDYIMQLLVCSIIALPLTPIRLVVNEDDDAGDDDDDDDDGVEDEDGNLL